MFAMRKFAMAVIGSALLAVGGVAGFAQLTSTPAAVFAAPPCPDDMHWCPGEQAPETAQGEGEPAIPGDDMHW